MQARCSIAEAGGAAGGAAGAAAGGAAGVRSISRLRALTGQGHQILSAR